MKNKTLAIFGIGTYILSVLSSIEIGGTYAVPPLLIAISGLATLTFIILASIRLWKEAKGLVITYIVSGFTLFIFTVIQILTSAPDGSPIIILMNLAKVVYLISFIMVIIKLFRIKDINKDINQTK